jgi:meiotic recombination protein SPO11
MRVLDLVHAAQSSPNPVTQRDIFYKDVVLFKTQSTSDQAIIRLANLLGVSREDMNIV